MELREGLSAVVDGFEPPATLRGWAVNRAGGRFLADVRVEAVRDGVVVARSEPVAERADVTGDPAVPAGFVLRCDGVATAETLLSGAVGLRAVDSAGASVAVPIWAPTQASMRQDVLVAAAGGQGGAAGGGRASGGEVGREAGGGLVGVGATGGGAAGVGAVGQAPGGAVGAGAGEVEADGADRVGATGVMATGLSRRGPKIVLIGAGSTVFAKNLIGDILLHPALRESDIWLYDIDAERLRVSEVVAGRIRQTLGMFGRDHRHPGPGAGAGRGGFRHHDDPGRRL